MCVAVRLAMAKAVSRLTPDESRPYDAAAVLKRGKRPLMRTTSTAPSTAEETRSEVANTISITILTRADPWPLPQFVRLPLVG